MPLTGNKRRNSSAATCDSSHCAFCLQRQFSGGAHSQLEHDSGSSRPSNEFESWLQHQTGSTAEHTEHISLDKIGLPSSQLDRPPSKRNRPSLDLEGASSSDSSDPNNCALGPSKHQHASMEVISASEGTPWEWLPDWANQPMPMPAGFSEICSFQQPSGRTHSVQHTADIVCGVEFSPDGLFIASAGVAKQVPPDFPLSLL